MRVGIKMNVVCHWLNAHINDNNQRHPFEVFVSIILTHLELCHWNEALYFIECAMDYSTTLEEQIVLDFLKNLACYESLNLVQEFFLKARIKYKDVRY